MKNLVCVEWNEAAQTCTVEGWADASEPFFPDLSLEQTQSLAGAIILLWAAAFVARALIRQAQEI